MFVKRYLSLVLSGIFLNVLSSSIALAADDCVTCHTEVTPGIVSQHEISKHATSEKATCSSCHGSSHKTNEDYKEAKMPTPETCAVCHSEQVEQLQAGKHQLAWIAMQTQAAYHGLPNAIGKEGYRGCSGCHKIGVKGLKLEGTMLDTKVVGDGGAEIAKYRYGNAQCDACHTRHSFKKAEAQDPRACANCHMGFDHPQWEMYMSSKHGLIWDMDGNKNDGRAPTCQSCHMAEGNHTVVTPWGFLGLRVPSDHNVRALIDVAPALTDPLTKLANTLESLGFTGNYIDLDDDPTWVFDRAIILQAAGVLDAALQPTQRFVDIVVLGQAARGTKDFNSIRTSMKKACNKCHAKDFVDGHFKASDEIIKASDHEFAKAIQAVQGLYKDGILQKPDSWEYGPDLLQFYDAETSLEQELYLIMLEYRQRAFQGAFHDSKDYMHWYGWAPLKTSVNNILEEVARKRAEASLQLLKNVIVVNMANGVGTWGGDSSLTFQPSVNGLNVNGVLTATDGPVGPLVGKAAKIVAIAAVNNGTQDGLYILNSAGELAAWDGQFGTISSFADVTLAASQSVDLLKGQMTIGGAPVSGTINLYLGVIVGDKLMYFPRTIDLNI
ncbi:multiheme c-type cytochrome [Candidatus Parabeggiatoa sp. HSG14]|uniref:multiheme c-type cytochrome n=1 Tax=Candidatus Parabeggiatoa sp. HSG14 TaxID=3055593 RepID=UPI0025A69016|nr:multiheme c-type cytochrome [Thiotrichales bacterium HSG14]